MRQWAIGAARAVETQSAGARLAATEITVNKGVHEARVEAETKEAKNLLLENLPALRDRLAQQNIKIQKFDVDLRTVARRHAAADEPGPNRIAQRRLSRIRNSTQENTRRPRQLREPRT